MFGKNKIAPLIKGNGDELEVVKIFKTIQGEGFFAGHPAIFLRLGGCNLKCYFCDTEFDKYSTQNIQQILAEITKLAGKTIKLVVITGGEPLRQPLKQICSKLIAQNFQVQIETNGTIKAELPKEVYIMCSPKQVKQQYQLSQELLDYVDALKFIVSKNKQNYNYVPELNWHKNIYIQPMDEYNPEQNQQNLEFAKELALKHGYILSLQQHKIINVE